MLTPEELAILVKLVASNTRHVDVLFGVVNDFACLIETQLERCCHTGCREPATVEQSDLKIRMCDACAAAACVRAAKNLTSDAADPLNMMRVAVANDDM
jgi:hypothetical protein